MTVSALDASEERKFRDLVAAFPAGDGCEERLASIACVSDKSELAYDPDCAKEKVDPETLKNLVKLASTLPPVQRKVFCKLDRLQLQAAIFSVGYASQITNDKGEAIGSLIGIRPTALLSGQPPFDVFTWKEQLSFGLSKRNDPQFSISPLGPRVVMELPSSPVPIATYVITHELSHLIDFMNGVRNRETCSILGGSADSADQTFSCNIEPGSFAALSWPSPFTRVSSGATPPEWLKAFPLVSKLCYYFCDKHALPKEMAKIYGALGRTSFMTSYASKNAREDFAEASTIYALKGAGVQYKVLAPNKKVIFDLEAQWKKPQWRAKRKWIAQFYSREDLILQMQSRK